MAHKPLHPDIIREAVNEATSGALDSSDYRVYINEFGYPMVEPIQTRGVRIVNSGIALFVYVIGLALVGIVTVAVLGLFAWFLFRVSGLLFGGS